MKKNAAALCAVIIILTACGKEPSVNTIKNGLSLSEVMDEVSADYAAEYGEKTIPNAYTVDVGYLSDMCGVAKADIDEVCGWISLSLTNSDSFIAVKCEKEKAEAVAAKMEERLTALREQYEIYPVNGSYERALSGKIHIRGDYVFLIAVGTGEYDASSFEEQVDFVVLKIDEHFN